MNSYPNRDNSRPTPLLDGTGAPVVVRGQSMPIRRYQVIVWVSVSVADFPWDPRTPAFPAILDTGNTFTLSIFQKQLIQWAGIQPPLLPNLGRIREGGQRYPCHEADVWLHPNVPGRRDRRSDRLPLRLQLAERHRRLPGRGVAPAPPASAGSTGADGEQPTPDNRRPAAPCLAADAGLAHQAASLALVMVMRVSSPCRPLRLRISRKQEEPP